MFLGVFLSITFYQLEKNLTYKNVPKNLRTKTLMFFSMFFYLLGLFGQRTLKKENNKRSNPFNQTFTLQVFCILNITLSKAFELKPTTLLSKQAVVGHGVHLPCELPRIPYKPSLILWYKDQNTKPFYSFDAREMVAGQHKVHDQFDLGQRANFSFASIPYPTKIVLGYLMVNNISLEDEGNFTCRVDFQKAQTMMSMLELKVLEPIWRIGILDSHEREVKKETGPYLESERLYLTCRAFGGHPPPVVEWLSGNEVIASSLSLRNSQNEAYSFSVWKKKASRKERGQVEAVLQLPLLRREDQGRSFSCRANNSNLTPVRTKVITINMSLRPVEILIEGPTSPLKSGEKVELVCKTHGSKPPAKIKWSPKELFKNINYQTSLDLNTTLSRVHLIPSPEDDGRRVNCTATNPLVPQYSITTAKTIVVLYAPQVEAKLASFLTPTNIKEGDDVYFECNVRSNPRPRSIIWLHEGREIKEQRDKGLLVQGYNLVLQKVSRHSRGRFQCKATNMISTVTSEPVSLEVKFIPECAEPSNVTVSVFADEEIQLNCSVESFPQPLEFIWRLNGSNGWETIDYSKVKNQGTLSTFLYSTKAKPFSPLLFDHSEGGDGKGENTRRSESSPSLGIMPSHEETSVREKSEVNSFSSDQEQHSSQNVKNFALGETYGVVYCLARNSVGRQREPCIFNISPAGPPGEVVSCSLSNQSATSFGVSCVPGRDGGLKQTFLARVLEERSRRIVANITSTKAQFFVTGLAPGKDYLVMVTAKNAKGTSEPYIIEGFALKVAENKINEQSSSEGSSILGMFVGVVTGFILVVVVLLLMARTRCRARRQENSDHHSVKQASGVEDNLLSATLNVDEQTESQEESNEALDSSCFQAPDLTAETPDSLGSLTSKSSKDYSKNDFLTSGTTQSQTEALIPSTSARPPLLGLSNVYKGGGGLPRIGSSYGLSNKGEKSSPSGTPTSATTLPTRSTTNIQQPLHSVDLPHVTSNTNKYYILKINCTRQSNESFV